MPRDSNGNYTLPPGINPVIPGTDIEADWANPTLGDIALAMTDSLSRTGSGGMLAPFRFADGSLAAPSISWTNHPQAGWYRAGPSDFRYAINGSDIFAITPAGASVTGALNVSTVINIAGAPAATINDAITYAVALG